MTLVQRNARGIRLTEAGEAVVRHADAIMARLAEAEAELEAIAGLRGGRLRMAAFESAGATLMPPAIAAFRAGAPARRAVAEHVRARGLRAAAAQRRARPGARLRVGGHAADDGIHRVHLIDDPMFLALPRDHPLRASAGACGWPTSPTRRGSAAARLRVQPADLARVRGRRLRAADRLRDRRLHGHAGLRRRRRRRLADRRARAHERPRRHRGALPRPRDAGAPDLRRHARGGYRSPATQAMLEILTDVASRYESRRPRLELVG